ncbi:peptidoglycan editing factor PgeF [Thermosipho sp. 1244]|uniref:peptidoglycan editing factor PgeF n=2 Tax=unclassified Thermosipho (in: thermotogales) TaxID=2676525 RepID=UPI0009860191|nr:peptidoglycan editing factor PgeF [Thermosipho sp. 1244]MBT1248282.1 polyphenol oxidoreductase [Thermosipho sp. 1244]OOC45490.1 polyphenol oxidoreductase [Thermosipho sp. 1223]
MQLGNYVCKEIENIVLCRSCMLHQFKKLFHVVTTRQNMELDFSLESDSFRILSNILGIELDRMFFAKQVHGNVIKSVEEKDIKRGVVYTADGLITNEKRIFLVMRFADCVPIIAYDSVKNVVGIAHSGWKGTLKDIPKKLILSMVKKYNSNPENIFVSLGPSISPESFEVGIEVKNMFSNKFGEKYIDVKNGKFFIDLWGIIEDELFNIGVRNIEISMVDTIKFNKYFYSYRKEKTKKRFAVIVGLI